MRISTLTFAVAGVAMGAVAVTNAGAQQQSLPLKHEARPTVPAITAADLMTRLYIFADDSMMGRQAGTPWNDKGTDYIESEVRRLGLKPGGDNGTFFQSAHLFARGLDSTATLTVDGKTFNAGTDFVAAFPADLNPLTSAAVVYTGLQLDTTNMPDVAGKIAVLSAGLAPGIDISSPEAQGRLVTSHGYQAYQAMLESAAAILVATPQPFTPERVEASFHPEDPQVSLLGKKTGATIIVTRAFGDQLFDTPMASVKKGTIGKTITANLKYHDKPLPGRNVVAILPGTDPVLSKEYVALGGHNDHIGFNHEPVDHDSMRAVLTIARKGGAEDPDPLEQGAPPLPPETWAKINALKDSLRAAHGGRIRMDSIYNGADDDGTGSMGVLEIAEAFAKAPAAQRPKRSLIFVWHVGEELGMFGSEYFTDHPTVPRDSIVTQLNVDMIGRGGPGDPVPWGGPTYLQLIGSRRLSTELGDIVEQVNRDTHAGFKYDYEFDANGDPHNYYCRSDHWAYARYGIPITFFTTGGHRDYHMITDEPQYIDYDHYARVAQLIHDIALRVGNLDHRPVVDGKKGDPYGTCQQ